MPERRGAAGQECIVCGAHSLEPDRDGWHVFTDTDEEEHTLCGKCATGESASDAEARALPSLTIR